MKTLIATVGLPRSGKSTWAIEQGFPIVCPDSIRLAIHGQRFLQQAESLVWSFAWNMVRSLFLSGHDTIIFDATSLTERSRNEIRKQMDINYLLSSFPISIQYKVFAVSKEICIERAEKTFPDLIPVIERMDRQREPIKLKEPFEKLFKEPFEKVYSKL